MSTPSYPESLSDMLKRRYLADFIANLQNMPSYLGNLLSKETEIGEWTIMTFPDSYRIFHRCHGEPMTFCNKRTCPECKKPIPKQVLLMAKVIKYETGV